MRPPVHLNAMRAFEASARHGSFSGAGEELNVTAAAVGQMVRSLEDWLQTPLFHRAASGRSRLVPTEAADRALPDIRAGLDRLALGFDRLPWNSGGEHRPGWRPMRSSLLFMSGHSGARQGFQAPHKALRDGAAKALVLFADGHEEVRLETWTANGRVSVTNDEGLEFFVIRGSFLMQGEDVGTGTWAGSLQEPTSERPWGPAARRSGSSWRRCSIRMSSRCRNDRPAARHPSFSWNSMRRGRRVRRLERTSRRKRRT